MDLSKRPSLEEKRNVITGIRKCQINNDYTHLDPLLHTLFDQFVNVTLTIAQGTLLYRGIRYSKKPESVNGIIYPPKELAKINRASLEGEQLFYCCSKKNAVFYELNLQAGDTAVISNWHLVKRPTVHTIGYTQANLMNLGTKPNDFDFSFKTDVKAKDLYEDSENTEVMEFLAAIFCQQIQDTSVYKLTTAIAKRFFDKDFEGVIYPTIQYNANAENFAFKPTLIDNGFAQFEKIEFIKVTGCENGRYTYQILDVADSLAGSLIQWKCLPQTITVTDSDEDLYFVDHGDGLKAYTDQGDIVPYDK